MTGGPDRPLDDTPLGGRNDTPVIIDVLGNDSDPDGDTLTITGLAGHLTDRPGQ